MAPYASCSILAVAIGKSGQISDHLTLLGKTKALEFVNNHPGEVDLFDMGGLWLTLGSVMEYELGQSPYAADAETIQKAKRLWTLTGCERLAISESP
ncbi:hypothetical protein FCL40_17670 [Ferrimonas sediminicola]|uniref:Uncharacterized protein n=1 Tax=Ferrimonas sediminicola TaxID=2569538 RepID=A0A4V5NUI0_9GAMM|nr:hypothetical protein [Ferrimonas sediminicola]TKB46485.1 hypothetical protein FCL40_17670 [Ferrimonas sediminicola]